MREGFPPVAAASLGEAVLYRLAKGLYRTEIAQSNEMKEASTDADKADGYRAAQVSRVVEAARRYGVKLVGRDVLDLGCHDGAMTVNYVKHGVRHIVGIDIDADAVRIATMKHAGPHVEYAVSRTTAIPLPDESVDTIICFDVFEHVSRPADVLAECRRVLRDGGRMLIGTWGWYHPFAPHLWAAMPVPWAHVVFSERTILRTCRRVFHSDWYVTNRHDVDEHGRKKADKYADEMISTDYLNKLFIRDFEKVFLESGLRHVIHPEPFGSKYGRWTKPLLKCRTCGSSSPRTSGPRSRNHARMAMRSVDLLIVDVHHMTCFTALAPDQANRTAT